MSAESICESEPAASARGVLSQGPLSAARDIVLVIALDGSILDANSAALEAYGHSRDELLAMKIFDLRADSVTDVEGQMQAAASQGTIFRTVHRRSDGVHFPVEVNSSGIELGGERALVSVVRDISDRLRREYELQDALARSQEANRQLDGMMRILTRAVGSPDLDTLLDTTVGVISELMSTDVTLFLVVEVGSSLRVRAQQGADEWTPRGYVLGPDEGFASRVARSGSALYTADVSRDTRAIPVHAALGIRSMFGVPVFVRGELFGVLECAWATDREVTASEQAMLLLAAERIALGIAGARLLERSRTAERLTAAVNSASRLVNASFGVSQAIGPMLAIAATALECDVAVYGILRDGALVVEHSLPADAPPARLPLTLEDMRSHTGEVQPVTLSASDPTRAWLAEDLGVTAVLAIPFHGRRDHSGAILLGRHKAAEGFTEAELDFAARLGDTVSIALSNALHFETEHRIAEALQEALLTVPAGVRGVEFSHRYQSATVSTRVGGDFFDIFEIADGRVGLVVGDVSGKGLEAAVLTSIIKDTIRAYAHEMPSPSPANVIAKANTVLERAATLPDFASVFFGIVDPADGMLTYCSAGHPPGAVVGVDGAVRLLEGGSPVIGAFADLEYLDFSTYLAASERIVLYTDGVTEARDEQGAFFAEQGLLGALSASGGASVAELPQVVFDAVMLHSGGRLVDDIALLVVQRA